MRAQLLHLSGPQRGQTITYQKDRLVFGTARGADVRYRDGQNVKPRHAELTFVQEECLFHLKAIEGEVFVNRQQVYEVILEHGDLLEIGRDGPKIRFRIHYEEGAVCKPVRLMLSDAKEVRGASGFFASTRALQRDLVAHSSWQVKVLLIFLVPLIVFLAAYLGGAMTTRRVARQEAQIREGIAQAYRQEVTRIGEQFEQFRTENAGRVSREEIDRLREEFDRRTDVLDVYAERGVAMRHVLEVSSRGVCLIHGEFTMKMRQGEEFVPVTGPDGEPLSLEYFGSGFLVSAGGDVVTNRHVAEPWWRNDMVASLVNEGMVPGFVHLTATFPGHEPIDVDPGAIRISEEEVDIALIKVKVGDVPVLPMFEGDLALLRGERVILLGYPTGLNALLARAEPAVVAEILAVAKDTKQLLLELAHHGAISPIITQGALNEVMPKRLVYDAVTTSGGSG